MTQEELNILNIDLCARLPYGVKIKYLPDDRLDGIVLPYLLNGLTVLQKGVISRRAHIKNIRPYLRPMSSMTEEEKEEFISFNGTDGCYIKTMDFCNKHHLDNRGLIPMGLALEAPEDMYKND